MFIAILDHPMFSKFDFPSLKTGIMAGSNCPVHVMEQVIDPETGASLTPGLQGEVCCRGYNVMKGYYNNPAATRT